MSRQYCLICASDEGIFLDIYIEGKNYRENIEKCLSIRIKKGTIQSTKICHKCAYEIDQCSKFVDKYKTSRSLAKKTLKRRGVCNLCMEVGPKGLIFSLNHDDDDDDDDDNDNNTLENSKKKLQSIFNEDFITDQMTNISICLDCRYNMDVLYDLKRIYEHFKNQPETDEDDNSLSDLQKIKTDVIKRKTTSSKSLRSLEETLNTENKSSAIKKKSKKLASFVKSKSNENSRECDECHEIIKASVDMYRYHHSGSKVCKNCWSKTDPNDIPVTKKRKIHQKSNTNTKLCSVFLEDIFSNSTNNKIKNLMDRTDDSEQMNDMSDCSTNGKKARKSLRNSQLKTKDISKKEKPSKMVKVATKKEVKNNELAKKNNRKSRSESTEAVSDISNRAKATKSRLKALQKKKREISQAKSENVEKSRFEERHKKLRLTRLRNRSKNSSPPLSTIETSKPKKMKKNEDLISNADSDSESSRPYTCNVCSTDYENRVEGMKHELRHSKELGVVLEKVGESESNGNDQISNEDKVDTSVSEASKNIENTPDFSPMTSDNDDNSIGINIKTIDYKINDTVEANALTPEIKIDDYSSEDISNKCLAKDNINKDQSQNSVNENQSKDINEGDSEDIIKKNLSQNHHNEELNTKQVDYDEQNVVASEPSFIADERNVNLDEKTANTEEENYTAKESHFEGKKVDINVDNNDCNDCQTNADLNETNQSSEHEISNNEDKFKKIETEYIEKDNSFKDNDATNDEYSVNNGGERESSIQRQEDPDCCTTENPNESISASDKKDQETSYSNENYVSTATEENEDGQSKEETTSINTEKQLKLTRAENEQMLIDDKTESENRSDDYEDNLVIDERVDNLESSVNIHSEESKSDKIDKLKKIIDASFGNSLQE
ncbi:uncharacterized protein DDB_G0287625-like [Cotesia glomerata]|uniref:C2H2-type domain-containing protein n=1 Tax=Cotesia glomerata TaxID=32391 RepID=A0AAV7IRL4_COTGL|nr:uncharacterized protein DDB_G0287625-like [Cotesia glomerata]KAH0555305.1 hypothetical protein KQX54_017528 [Cotesia glomerata]